MAIKIYAYIAIVAAILGGLFYVNHLRAANKELKRQAAIYETQISGLTKNLKNQAEALKAREIESARLTAETNELKGRLDDIYKNDPLAAAWAVGLMPDAVFNSLRQ